MRISLLVLMIFAGATTAFASAKKNFAVSVPLKQFVEIFRSQLETQGSPVFPLWLKHCGENSRVYCTFNSREGLSISVSGDAVDGEIDLYSVQNQAGGLDPHASTPAIYAIIQLTNPDLTGKEINEGMLKLAESVFGDRKVYDTFETDKAIYRLGLSPIQGTIFTASPK